jgi:hypothetical protein
VGVGPAGEDERGEGPPETAAGDAPPEPPRGETPGDGDLLGVRGRVIAGVVFFALYAISFSLRGLVLPGLVGGVLGGILVYLVFKEVDARRRRRRPR